MKVLRIVIILFSLGCFNIFPQQDNKITIGESIKIKSKILNEDRNIFISLPVGYDPKSSYPVLYLLDGETHFQYTSGLANFLAISGRIPQLIIVGIPNVNRNRDLTPTSSGTMPGSGGGPRFLEFIKDELIPYIEDNYSTQPYRILFGHSAGGMFTTYALLSYPELFNAYIAASPYVVFDNSYVLKLAKEQNSASFKTKKIFFMTIGNEPDYFDGLDELTGIFKLNFAENFEWYYTKRMDENHATISLKTIYDGLETIYSGWRLPDNFAEAGDLEKLREHYEKISDDFGYEVKAPEEVVNIFGYQVMGSGRMEEALKIFEYNIKQYPKSANAFDSYGEGLERAGKLELAKRQYELAVKTGKEINDPNTNIYQQHLDNIIKKIAE